MGKSAMIKVQVINKEGTIIAEAVGTKEVNLPVSRTYEEGDRVVFLADEIPAFYVFQADDALGEALVYVTGEVSYEIPFGEKKVCYSPKIFSGESHLVTARKAREWEYESYRNLAVNVMDQHGDTNCYPHATANVETRGESVFAARNAIDGVTSNHSHGYWPYGSWGINRNPQATMRVDFGREVSKSIHVQISHTMHGGQRQLYVSQMILQWFVILLRQTKGRNLHSRPRKFAGYSLRN